MDNIIMLGSITYAFKARDYLKSHGIASQIIKTPKELNSCGCGYSIKTDSYAEAIKLLHNKGIKILNRDNKSPEL